jgi:hypothetical protein
VSSDSSDEAERKLARAVAWGLPAVTVVGAIAVGAIGSLGSALLVLAAGGLLGAVALLWASLRTLSGDAPLGGEGEAQTVRPGDGDLAERKLRVMLALKDIESEHALGKIDEADYGHLVATYREEAKAVMREMDRKVDPSRGEAERVARNYLARHGFGGNSLGEASEPSPVAKDRMTCRVCNASNEIDAAFCKSCGSAMKETRGRDAKT